MKSKTRTYYTSDLSTVESSRGQMEAEGWARYDTAHGVFYLLGEEVRSTSQDTVKWWLGRRARGLGLPPATQRTVAKPAEREVYDASLRPGEQDLLNWMRSWHG